MENKKDDAEQKETTIVEGAKRLKLSVQRMKKLNTDIKAGGSLTKSW